ncbi:MAG: hydrogenase expression/formation protein HypE [Nitrospirae bacterium]|nr:hydrogenase expression/formation protein HypE [Nitrospirota bacterium]
MDQLQQLNLSCPLPLGNHSRIQLAHGGGGRLTQQLIRTLFLPEFQNEWLEPLHDGARLPVSGATLAFTTDSYVVSPIIFPGGDIGRLAVNGTVNDLAMCGAHPLYLSAALIIEEGLLIETLQRVARSMREAADEAGISLVTGDTKVVDRGKGDQLFITTSGVGLIEPGVTIDPRRAAPGDRILVSGPIGRHGIAVLSVRDGLAFESPIESDTAPLGGLVEAMLAASKEIHVLRDPTRGGVASALNEIAGSAHVGMRIHEAAIPIDEAVQGACELLGLDPLYVANEGRLVAVVPPEDADRVLAAMREHPAGREAAAIGEVTADHPGLVVLRSRAGGDRVIDLLSGEQLPRIC